MNEFIEYARNNQFLSGGLITVIFSAALLQSKSLIFSFQKYLRRKICSTIYTESNETEDFFKIDYWVSTKYLEKANSYLLKETKKIGQCSFFQIKNWCILNINKNIMEKDNIINSIFRYHINIYGLKKHRNQIINEIANVEVPREDSCPLRHNYNFHGYIKKVQKPITESAKIVYNDFLNFLEQEEKYDNFNVKYHRNYLLSGLPGTGKTSLIKYIARQTKRAIQSVSITPDMEDADLLHHFEKKTSPYLFVIEDLDRVDFNHKDNCWSKQVLYNILDGMYTYDGCTIFATVNDITKLDEALIRSGRFDMQIEITNPTDEELMQYIKENNIPISLEEISGKKISDIQKIIKTKI